MTAINLGSHTEMMGVTSATITCMANARDALAKRYGQEVSTTKGAVGLPSDILPSNKAQQQVGADNTVALKESTFTSELAATISPTMARDDSMCWADSW
eukprot:CAMPEP_0115346158 /NCGR_PEP_ID=MMETSP0270-20121206/94190_1 /TAXON_ID=71861 /ORGANISM="Scrippsiella trochoidea, Strain CCMP3099" /LENGTH=98 /DNA_ID=CAMNT_0002767979 /DNA_START=435 /DNA_END=729 /DNA_ORIENTATION=-